MNEKPRSSVESTDGVVVVVVVVREVGVLQTCASQEGLGG